jgi:hypothetical protein
MKRLPGSRRGRLGIALLAVVAPAQRAPGTPSVGAQA